jgi:transposase
MKRFIEGDERSQVTLLPECLDDYIAEDNPVRVVDVFVDELRLHDLASKGPNRPRRAGRRTTQQSYSRSTSTAISTASNRADAWSEKRNATSS